MMLPFVSVTIGPGATAQLQGHPQGLYRPRRLVPAKRYPTLKLVGLDIGNRPQLASRDACISLESFVLEPPFKDLERSICEMTIKGLDAPIVSRLREEIRALGDNLGQVETAQPGMSITVFLRNDGPEPVHAELHMLGSALID